MAEDGAGLATALGEGCEVCSRLPRAGRVRSRLNGSEGLAVASRRSGEGRGWRLTAEKGDELPPALVALVAPVAFRDGSAPD